MSESARKRHRNADQINSVDFLELGSHLEKGRPEFARVELSQTGATFVLKDGDRPGILNVGGAALRANFGWVPGSLLTQSAS